MAKKPSSIRAAREFVRNVLDERSTPPLEEMSRFHKFVHFWVLVGKSFVRNRCPVRASALAYASLLALIPMLAVAVSITSALLKKEGEERIDQFIAKVVNSVTSSLDSNQEADTEWDEWYDYPAIPAATKDGGASTNSIPEAVAMEGTNAPAIVNEQKAIELRKEGARRIHEFIRNTRSGALGLTGTVFLIFAAISMLSRIESTFNDIWGVARGRNWFMRIVLYWGVLTLGPILLIVALGLVTGSHSESARRMLVNLPLTAWFFSQVLPVVLLCLSFTVFYMLIPNTRVRWAPALVGGIVSGLLWHLNSLASVLFVSRVVSNSKIYGSIAIVPVFMIGLYFSWLILLFGAQVAYAFQNRATYFEEKQVDLINQRGREFIALRLMTLIGQRFLYGAPPPTALDIGSELSVPTRLTRQLMSTLAGARLVVETSGGEPAFLPARPLENITCHDILVALRRSNGQELAQRDEPGTREVYGEFNRIEEAERQAAESVTMLALVNRAGQGRIAEGAGETRSDGVVEN